jgi:hypothetical protein
MVLGKIKASGSKMARETGQNKDGIPDLGTPFVNQIKCN